jgi:hypothetical protein
MKLLLREPAEHGPGGLYVVAGEQVVEPAARLGVRRQEGVPVREADLAHDVPVRPARRKRQRTARRCPEEAPVGVEDVEQREEVVLVGAAAVQEDQRALWLGAGRTDALL